MIVTVTPNPAVDRVLVVPGFKTGSTNRAVVGRMDIGGKGINVARHLAQLGCGVIATGFLGAEDLPGIVDTLRSQGVQCEFVRVAGETRVNLKILDPVSGQDTEINEPGPLLAPDDIDALLERVRSLAPRCAVMVFSGSLTPGMPDDFYARAIGLAAGAGARTILDATGAALREGIAAKPDLVKPNRAEAEELLGVSLHDEDQMIAAAKRLVERGARTAVISLGPAGAICASAGGTWRARAPQITARNTVGSGDAMVAALAWALMRSLPAPDSLRLATALGSATAASDTPLPPAGCFEALLPAVLVNAAESGETPHGAARIGS
jgi:1-phosphofructokinase